MHRLLLAASLFSLIFLCNVRLLSQEKKGIQCVVIDAGHGGKDPGAIGKKVQEKKITLSIALKLGALIKQNFPSTRVIFTRDKDVFVELHERAGIANRNKADLFISIHCNANRSRTFHGAETYVMGLHKSEANLSIAKMENSSILMEPDYANTYEGFDPNSDESYITFSLFQNIYLDQSMSFASIIQNNLTESSGMDDRGVRQAGFMVLYKTTMPSVLVETGFLSNPSEETFLCSEKGQNQIANAIFRAFKSFRSRMEGVEEKEAMAEKQLASVEAPVKEKNKELTPVQSRINNDTQKKQNSDTSKKQITAKPKEPPKKEIPPAEVPKSDEISFRVQFFMSPKPVPVNSKKFSGLKDVRMYKHQGSYKYTCGGEKELQDAINLTEEVKKAGFRDAFVVAFKGDQRITISQAKSFQAAAGRPASL